MAEVLVSPTDLNKQNTAIKLPPRDPLKVRLIAVIGDVAELSLKNNLDKPVKIFEIYYTATRGGKIIKGTIPSPGTLKPCQMIPLQAKVPSPPPEKLKMLLVIPYEYEGVPFEVEVEVVSN